MIKRLFSVFFLKKIKTNNTINEFVYDDMPKESYMNKLIKDDNNFNVGNFFLVATTIVGLLLLIVPLFVLTIEAWFNHTITTDLSGMASYIVAVCSIFTVGGLTHGWTSWSRNKFNSINTDSDGNSYTGDDSSYGYCEENEN